MEKEEILVGLSEAVVDGDDELVTELTEKAIGMGIEPLSIINDGLTKGIQVVGVNFSNGKFYLPDLLLGAEAMDAGIKILEPLMVDGSRASLGKVLMGTV